MGFLEVFAGVTKIKVAPNDLLGSSEASETPSGCSCPPQLHLGSRRTSGVLMGFLEVLAGVTKIKVAPNDLLGPSQHVADCFLINAQ